MSNPLIPEEKTPAEKAPTLTPSRPPKFERGDKAFKGTIDDPNGPYEVTSIFYCPHADDWFCCLGNISGTHVIPQRGLISRSEIE